MKQFISQQMFTCENMYLQTIFQQKQKQNIPSYLYFSKYYCQLYILSNYRQLHTSSYNAIFFIHNKYNGDICATQNDRRLVTGQIARVASHQPTYKWVEVSHDTSQPIPSSSTKHAVCFYGGALFLFGGKDGNIPHKHLWKCQLGKLYRSKSFSF